MGSCLRVNSLQFLSLRVNSLQFFPFKGEFFAIFILPEWILYNFYRLRVNSLYFLLFKGELFAIFILKGEFLAIFTLQWVNSLQFLLFNGWILCNFYPLRMNSLQFSRSRYSFPAEKDKNFSFNAEFFENFNVILVNRVFLCGILRVCCFDTNYPLSFGWFSDIFYPSRVYFLQFLPFCDENGQTLFL